MHPSLMHGLSCALTTTAHSSPLLHHAPTCEFWGLMQAVNNLCKATSSEPHAHHCSMLSDSYDLLKRPWLLPCPAPLAPVAGRKPWLRALPQLGISNGPLTVLWLPWWVVLCNSPALRSDSSGWTTGGTLALGLRLMLCHCRLQLPQLLTMSASTPHFTTTGELGTYTAGMAGC
jgi:hypothetical protein